MMIKTCTVSTLTDWVWKKGANGRKLNNTSLECIPFLIYKVLREQKERHCISQLRLCFAVITNNPQVSTARNYKCLLLTLIDVHCGLTAALCSTCLSFQDPEWKINLYANLISEGKAQWQNHAMALKASNQKWHTFYHISLDKAGHKSSPCDNQVETKILLQEWVQWGKAQKEEAANILKK